MLYGCSQQKYILVISNIIFNIYFHNGTQGVFKRQGIASQAYKMSYEKTATLGLMATWLITSTEISRYLEQAMQEGSGVHSNSWLWLWFGLGDVQ